MRLLALSPLLFLLAPSLSAGEFVYISLNADHRIAVYSKDATSGELTPAGQVDTEGDPGSLAVDPHRRFLFAALRTSKQLASYRIDGESGALTHISTTIAKQDPAYVTTDVSGRWLLAAYYASGEVSVHAIDETGRLDPEGTWYTTAEKAHCILPEPTNWFVFVPHTAAEAIFQFHFDEQTGALTPNKPAVMQTPRGYGPRHMVFHHTLNVAYVDNEQGSSVSRYVMDRYRGTLTPRDTVTTLPPDFTGENSNADLRLTPDSRFLYVSNRGHDSLTGYSVAESDGRLTPIGNFPTEPTPRSFHIDPTGTFLYAAGQSSGKLAAYRIDDATGKLDRFATYDVGQAPWWVLVVETGQRIAAVEPLRNE
jgi:6-phosphogluconolactonase